MIKSRIQTDKITSPKFTSTLDCIKQTINAGGIRSLFRGLTPTIIRAFPVNAVTFTVVTWTMRLCDGTYFTGTFRQSEKMLQRYMNSVGKPNAWEYSFL